MKTPKQIDSYTIHSDGKITSQYGWRGKVNHEVVPIKNKYGYLEVRLTLNGKRKKVKLHKLIAELFLEKPSFLRAIVRHLDGNIINNDVSNLAWGTHKDNAIDREKHGKTSRGSKHSLKIREALKSQKANAHLIAAAPEMLEALEKVLEQFNWLNKDAKAVVADAIESVEISIKKAKGEP